MAASYTTQVGIPFEVEYKLWSSGVQHDTDASFLRWYGEETKKFLDEVQAPPEVSRSVKFNTSWTVDENAEIHLGLTNYWKKV